MARLKTDQARSIWMRLVVGYFAAVIVFTFAFLGFGLLFGKETTAIIGDKIADATAPWAHVPIEQFNDMIMAGDLDTSNLQVVEQGSPAMSLSPDTFEKYESEAIANGTIAESSAGFVDNASAYKIETPHVMIAYRDLTEYNRLKELKFPAIVLLYLICLLVITVVFMRKPVRAVDAVAGAIAAPELARGEHVQLPAKLKPTQTELDLLQMRIVSNEKAAREAEERKNELVTYLAHDIRTPLTSVLGYLELMSEEDCLPPDKRREFASRAFAKAERLQSLVEELFEITRYNMQTIPIEREELDVGLLCQQVAEEFYPQAQARGLVIEVDAQAGLMALLDASRMGRVLENLVKNALAHATPGTVIYVRASREEHVTGSVSGGTTRYPLVISVTNQGKEIAPEHLEHVFDRFYRGDVARGQNTGGAGLGLAIAQEIVEAHGGGIAVDSSEGTTSFTITL